MVRESDNTKKKKKEKSFWEEVLLAMLSAALKAALDEMFDSIFGDMVDMQTREGYIDDLLLDYDYSYLIDEAVKGIPEEYQDIY